VSSGRHATSVVSRVGEQLGELTGEERMTGGAAVHLSRPPFGRAATDGSGDKVIHLIRRQPV
jgi:hypothetical protein